LARGIRKVSLTKLKMEKLGMSLKESKSNVDFLLENDQIILKINDENLAIEFLTEAEKIGVNGKFSPTSSKSSL
jgi:hypothetical protein